MRYSNVGRPESQRRDLVVVAALAAGALVLSAFGPRPTFILTQALRASVLRPFLAAHELFETRAGLSARVEVLGRERDSLAVRALLAGDLARENHRLRTLLDLPARDSGRYFVMELLPGRTPDGESTRFLIRAPDGVPLQPPVAVATPAGLLGVVRTAAGGAGFGDYWTHPDFRAAVATTDGDATGIVRPYLTSQGDQLMLMEGVAFQTAVAPGTEIMTSGVGGIYPRGLPVGRVLAEHEAQFGWTHSFLVEPSARPGQESVVLGWLPGEDPDAAPDGDR